MVETKASRPLFRAGPLTIPIAAILAFSALVGYATGVFGGKASLVLVAAGVLMAISFLRVTWGVVALAAALPWYHLTAVPLLTRAKVTAFDAIGLVLLGAVACRGILFPRDFRIRFHMTGALLALLTGFASFAFASSLTPDRFLFGAKPYIAVLVFYWLVYASARGDQVIRTALLAFVAGTAAAEATGLIELIAGTTLLGQPTEPLRVMGVSGSLEAVTGLSRVAGLYGDPNFYAMTGLAALPPAGALYLAAHKRRDRVMLLCAVGVLVLAVSVGASRGVAAAALVALLVFIVMSPGRYRSQLLALGAATAVVVVLSLPHAYFQRMLVTGDESIIQRLDLEEIALAAVASAPWLGHGPDFLIFQFSTDSYSYIHNTYLQMAAEAGIPALVGLLAVMIAAIWTSVAAFRRRQMAGSDTTLFLALVPALSAHVVFFIFFSYYGNKTFWFLTALASAAAVSGGAEFTKVPARTLDDRRVE